MNSNNSKYFAVDLFSGCGGATLGLSQAGFNVVGAVELDSQAADCYKQNHKNVNLIQSDIREISNNDFLAFKIFGEISAIIACPPCQGFSRINTRNSKPSCNDPRNSLYLEVLRVVRILEPKAVMLENVPEFKNGYRFSRLCRELHSAGYRTTYEILDVAAYGVPQRRRRLFLIALRGNQPELAPPSPERITVRTTLLRYAANLENDLLHNLPHRISERVRDRISSIPQNGGGRTSLPDHHALPCHKRNAGYFGDVYGRMHWDDVAPTITAGIYSPSKGRFLHPEYNRCISLREASLLQSFPQDYCFPTTLGKMKIASLIGNAVPPEFIRRQAEHLMRQIDERAPCE